MEEAIKSILPIMLVVTLLIGLMAALNGLRSGRAKEEASVVSELDKEVKRVKNTQKKRSLFGFKF